MREEIVQAKKGLEELESATEEDRYEAFCRTSFVLCFYYDMYTTICIQKSIRFLPLLLFKATCNYLNLFFDSSEVAKYELLVKRDQVKMILLYLLSL